MPDTLSDLIRHLHELEQQLISLPELAKARRHQYARQMSIPPVVQALLSSGAAPLGPQEVQERDLLLYQIADVSKHIRSLLPRELIAPEAHVESSNGKKRGRKATTPHKEIAAIVNRFGASWRKESDLEKIAALLDEAKISPRENWKNLSPPARTWKRAVSYYGGHVIRALEYSLKEAPKN